MCSTLFPITAASVCFIPLTSGRPVCKQNGGQHREGSEQSISRSPKDTMSWDRVCDREILLCFSDSVGSCFQRRLAISYCQPITPQNGLLAKKMPLFLTVWRQRGPRSIGQGAEGLIADGVPGWHWKSHDMAEKAC